MIATINDFVVLADDYGIRPAGAPDERFYCHRKVGQLHRRKCYAIVKNVTYDVLANGVKVGTFTHEEPSFWDAEACESHKNESSWCSDNALHAIAWLDTREARQAEATVEALSDEDCSCGMFEFVFAREDSMFFRAK
jgi:hypothetical protein